MNGLTGTQDLYLTFAGGSGFLFNVNWWQFTGAATGGNLLATRPARPRESRAGPDGGVQSQVLSVAGRLPAVR